MKMEMKNRLPGIPAAVHDDAKAVFRNSFDTRKLRGDTENITRQGWIAFQFQHRFDVPARNNQNVDRRPRHNVSERDHAVVLINNVAFYLAGNDAAKETIRHRLPLASAANV